MRTRPPLGPASRSARRLSQVTCAWQAGSRAKAALPVLNAWIGELFDRDNFDSTVTAMLAAQDGHTHKGSDRDAAKRRLADAETQLSRLHAMAEAGPDRPRGSSRSTQPRSSTPRAQTEPPWPSRPPVGPEAA